MASRYCELCKINIDHKRSHARFCCRKHKQIVSNRKRDYISEYKLNKEARRAQALKCYYKDHEKSKKLQLERQKRRLPQVASYEATRRALKLQRTPSWLTEIDKERIRNEYKLAALQSKITGEPWHVDHIVPLQGEFVSGLHVPSNLKAIRGKDNISKHNKFEIL
ncbi:hypothetical protein UFOVP1640_78 [uncultured Caudovirales phage]|uniref:HNHc domain containing protein n=1 Tax=uncultured Caudovirales phage TaxID=2100421 RepID=A0A6J5RG98_9CAUD|nr:hypothetical protein UFOVP1286_81 [uncultured Caudovirales phage]CAB4205523.1 hypothetical protein UFOVP1407_18 [uncultured Caudovirales phage]CAB4221677.1 hypothetical protein UFOVP1640_78 [uncultured Caudovirales phage]